MKNKNKILFASTTSIAVLLSACSFTEVSVQEKFSNEISKIASAETIQGEIHTSYILDKDLLMKKGFSEDEINSLEKEMNSGEFLIEYKSNKEQIELIIKGQLKDDELGIQLPVEIPIVMDLKNNKVYTSFTPFMESIVTYMIDSLTKEMKDTNVTDEEIESVLKESREELNKYQKEGVKFIDLNSYLKENSEDTSAIDLLNNFQFEEYDLINKNEENINQIVNFIKSLDKESFTVSEKGEMVSLNLNSNDFNAFNNVYYLYPENKLDKNLDFEENEDYKDIDILSEYILNNQYDSLGKGLISYKMKGDKLNELTIRNTFNIKEYSYEQRADYKSLKINEPVKFKYKIKDIKIFTKEETEKEIMGLSMLIFMFVMTQTSLEEDFFDEELVIKEPEKGSNDSEEVTIESKLGNHKSNKNFDWDNWENWEGY